MKHVRLPSGCVFNLACVVMMQNVPEEVAVDVFVGPAEGDMIRIVGDDAVMLRTWMEKRPALVPPARGKKVSA